MPQVTIYVPNELYQDVQRLRAYINLSRVCQLALAEEVRKHEPLAGTLTCPRCGQHRAAS